jgi:hypothetical protein
MADRIDFFVSDDGTPGDDVMDTTWVDPEVHVGRLYAELSDGVQPPGLTYVTANVDRVADDVRDALASVGPDQVAELGTRWATTDELRTGGVSAAEATAVLHDLVGLCVSARDAGKGLYVART